MYGFAAAVAAVGAPAVSDFYDVYHDDYRLLYVREPCAAADTTAKFFLHIVPAHRSDLPLARRQYGFANLDFDFETYGLRIGDRCQLSVPLPEWNARNIRTGQYTNSGRLWDRVFPVGAQ